MRPPLCDVQLAAISATAIGAESDIVSADQHGAIGIEQSSVQLLGGSKFYHLSMRIKYSS
jgi:hypothetical protein